MQSYNLEVGHWIRIAPEKNCRAQKTRSALLLRRLGLLTLGWFCVGLLFIIMLNPISRARRLAGIDRASSLISMKRRDAGPSFPDDNREPEPPHLPLRYLSTARNLRRAFNKSCAILPTLFELKINNVYWQHFVANDGTNFYLYGAYHDPRPLAVRNRLRILAMVDRIPPPTTFCHLWREREEMPSFSSDSTTYHYMWNVKWGNSKNGTLHPILLNCPTSSELDELDATTVAVVSLVERLCDNATNALRIAPQHSHVVIEPGNVKRSTSIAVCVKGLNYLHEDRSMRLIEWLELVRILGAHRVFMYDFGVHPNVTRVLRHYERQGFVDVRPLTLPGDQINEPRQLREIYLSRKISRKRQNELIPYNDCLYRNVGRYDYVVLLDTDEVIVPVGHELSTWQQLIGITSGLGSAAMYSCICALNVYFFDNDIKTRPSSVKGLHMLSHVRRARNFTKAGHHVKCFHDTAKVITLHNHYPMSCGYTAKGKCRRYHVDTRDGRLQHYRRGCALGLEKSRCAPSNSRETVADTAIWRYGRKLVSRVRATLDELQHVI